MKFLLLSIIFSLSLNIFCMENHYGTIQHQNPLSIKQISKKIKKKFSVCLIPDCLTALTMSENDYNKIAQFLQKNQLTENGLIDLEKNNIFVKQTHEYYAEIALQKFQSVKIANLPYLKNINDHALPKEIKDPLRKNILQKAYNTFDQEYQVQCQHQSTIESWDLSHSKSLFASITHLNKAILWNLAKEKVVEFPQRKGIPNRIKISPLGLFIAIYYKNKKRKTALLEKWGSEPEQPLFSWKNAPYNEDCVDLVLTEKSITVVSDLREYCFVDYLEEPIVSELKNINQKPQRKNIRFITNSWHNSIAIITQKISHPANFFFLKTMINNAEPTDDFKTLKNSKEYNGLYEVEKNRLNDLITTKQKSQEGSTWLLSIENFAC